MGEEALAWSMLEKRSGTRYDGNEAGAMRGSEEWRRKWASHCVGGFFTPTATGT